MSKNYTKLESIHCALQELQQEFNIPDDNLHLETLHSFQVCQVCEVCTPFHIHILYIVYSCLIPPFQSYLNLLKLISQLPFLYTQHHL